ncbi:hypothetical protein [Neobacillus vireti]|uniref:Uncharacterized protein n=1 Tax=Neobacillus vireti LMG 21834 TaxID=1131730 RepID=A0AB94ITC0_9BACI|nr:hypothetical protein [Neobacillus vireti]ETI70295.1 hypothetical protein BAVI_03099 [Neobacillus vireti LMG 21834]KLT16830.1 hypothetical protein AA980_13005 [Neobacillus vireti]
MIKNEKGSTLLVVLLMILVFTILGLTILSASIGGAKRTEIRKESIVENLDAIRNLNEAAAYIKKTIKLEYTPEMSIEDYNQMITDKILNNKLNYQITNDRPDLKEFTRVLLVSSKTPNGQSYSQTVYITPMPSFLKYAIGSRDVLTINGSLYIKQGNIYANKKLEISNQARYVYNNISKTVNTFFPSVYNKDNNFLFLENKNINYCDYRMKNCYNGSTNNTFLPLNISELKNAFDPHAPIYSNDDSEFVEVDIIKTFIEKLKNSGIIDPKVRTSNMSNADLLNLVNTSISSLYIKGGNNDVQILNSFNNIENNPLTKNYLYNRDAYIDINKLTVDKTKWLVINGDAYFENIGNDKMDVAANILVTGNVSIKGNVAFNSTIYVLGKTTINNVNISGLDNGELILMTQKDLEIARINKFQNPDSTNLDQVNSIKAFLYTNSAAVVYAIGSYIYIDGGLFAHGNLEVNAFRGTVPGADSTDLTFVTKSDEKASRLIIKNNKKLFINQAQGLPKVDQLEVLTDLMKKD